MYSCIVCRIVSCFMQAEAANRILFFFFAFKGNKEATTHQIGKVGENKLENSRPATPRRCGGRKIRTGKILLFIMCKSWLRSGISPQWLECLKNFSSSGVFPNI